MKEIARGAEAVIYLEKNTISKIREPKKYRISHIDNTLRKTRTRREAKILDKLPVPGPKLISFDDNEMKIEMEYLKGEKLRDVFDVKWCKEIGRHIAVMHNMEMIHGDLTTSNMILKGRKIYFIDFGLSFFSKRIEDKAVDLHLLKQALESRHYKVFEKAFSEVIKAYKKTAEDAKEVLERLAQVEGRGRHKGKRN